MEGALVLSPGEPFVLSLHLDAWTFKATLDTGPELEVILDDQSRPDTGPADWQLSVTGAASVNFAGFIRAGEDMILCADGKNEAKLSATSDHSYRVRVGSSISFTCEDPTFRFSHNK